jgi:ribosomal protein L37AE/L43A
MSNRMAAQYCPYCGEQDLQPTENDGQWECRDCIRVFAVRFVGISAQALSAVSTTQGTDATGGSA